MVEFSVERELITLKTEARYMKELPVSKKKGKGCIPLNYYAMWNFSLSILPIKLNLPMVYGALPWKYKVDIPSTLADI